MVSLKVLGAALIVCCAVVASAAARAECLGDHGGLDGPYAELLRKRPLEVVAAMEQAIKSPSGAQPDAPALQFAILADAYDLVGKREAARGAIVAGLRAIRPGTNPLVALRLALRDAGLREDSATASEVLARYERAAVGVSTGHPFLVCVLSDRGYLRYRAGSVGPAIADLTAAFDLTRRSGSERDRVDVGSTLSLVYKSIEFNDEALALANEAVTYYSHSAEPVALADAYYRRGLARTAMHDYPSAEADLQRAIVLAKSVGDAPDEYYARLILCDLQVQTRRWSEAGPQCLAARRGALLMQDYEAEARTRVFEAESLLGMGQPLNALTLVNIGLKQGAELFTPQFLVRAYAARAGAQAALGNYRAAFADANMSREMSLARERALDMQQVAALRVRFEIVRKDRELQDEKQGRALAAARADRDRVLRNFVLLIAGLALLSAIILASALQRRRIAEGARHAAEKQLESLGRLAAGIAHDFNNLLTVVQQAAGMLLKMPAVRENAEASELVQASQYAAKTGGSITQQLLSFGQQQNLRPEKLVLSEFFASQRGLWARVVGERHEVQIDEGVAGLIVHADRAQLSSAIVNLLSNARDATSPGGLIRVRAAAGASIAAAETRIEVTDRGCGMSQQVLDRATEPFYSTKEPGRGSGLGLSAVEGFVRQSGGRLQIDSTPGVGTTVTLTLLQRAPAASGRSP